MTYDNGEDFEMFLLRRYLLADTSCEAQADACAWFQIIYMPTPEGSSPFC